MLVYVICQKQYNCYEDFLFDMYTGARGPRLQARSLYTGKYTDGYTTMQIANFSLKKISDLGLDSTDRTQSRRASSLDEKPSLDEVYYMAFLDSTRE